MKERRGGYPGVRQRMALLGFATLAACSREVVLWEGPEERPTSEVGAEEIATACDRLCAAAGTCDPWRGFCATACEAVVVEGCEAEAERLITCLEQSAPCDLESPACADALDALVECAPPDHCDASACIIEPGTCSCAGLCGGDVLVQECIAEDAGGARCECLRDGEVVATCDAEVVGCTFTSCCSSVPL